MLMSFVQLGVQKYEVKRQTGSTDESAAHPPEEETEQWV